MIELEKKLGTTMCDIYCSCDIVALYSPNLTYDMSQHSVRYTARNVNVTFAW